MLRSWPTILAVFLGGGLTAVADGGFMDPALAAAIVTLVGAGLTRLAHRMDPR